VKPLDPRPYVVDLCRGDTDRIHRGQKTFARAALLYVVAGIR